MSASQKSFKEELKTATKYLHDEIEATDIAQQMANGEVSTKDYAQYLNYLLDIHTKLESKALSMRDEWDEYGIEIGKRLRSSLLENDIASLGVSIDPKGSFACDDWSFAKLIGGMYVLEGSTMGGQILSQRLAHLKATSYFQGYKEETLQKWLVFSKFIDTYAEQNQKQKDLVSDGAKSVYKAVTDSMRSIQRQI